MNAGRQRDGDPTVVAGRSAGSRPIRTDGGTPDDDHDPDERSESSDDPDKRSESSDESPAETDDSSRNDAGEVGRDGEEAASGGTGGGGNDPDGGEDDSDPDGGDETPPDRQSIIRDQRAEIDRLRSELRDLEDRVDRKAVDREDLEGRLRRYVRWRQRRGYARSWGPYIVLLYGVILTLAAFYTSHLYGGWTILAMLVIWLSTLGLYALMVIVGMTLTGTSWLGLARDALQQRR